MFKFQLTLLLLLVLIASRMGYYKFALYSIAVHLVCLWISGAFPKVEPDRSEIIIEQKNRKIN